jgi:hypothetical protein
VCWVCLILVVDVGLWLLPHLKAEHWSGWAWNTTAMALKCFQGGRQEWWNLSVIWWCSKLSQGFCMVSTISTLSVTGHPLSLRWVLNLLHWDLFNGTTKMCKLPCMFVVTLVTPRVCAYTCKCTNVLVSIVAFRLVTLVKWCDGLAYPSNTKISLPNMECCTIVRTLCCMYKWH